MKNPPTKPCGIEGCDLPAVARGMCRAHYMRWRNGARGAALEAPVKHRRPKGRLCVVDGCQRKAVSHNDLCGMHYYRWKTWGHVGSAESNRPGNSICQVDGCDRLARARGWCSVHYQRWRAEGHPGEATLRNAPGEWNGAVCSVDGCDRGVSAKGLCATHYGRMLRGTPLDKPIAKRGLTRKAKGQGYVMVRVGDVPGADKQGWMAEHRWVMAEHLGRPLRAGENVHHINGKRDDNRLENLELWSKAQPSGQRVEDKVAWAKELLSLYAPHELAAPVSVEQLRFI